MKQNIHCKVTLDQIRDWRCIVMVLMVEAVLNFHWIDIHTWRNSQEHSTDETMPKCGLKFVT
ncbi:hypothetical protein Plhal304r1_c044g0124161 [Plasmopara halstedii]